MNKAELRREYIDKRRSLSAIAKAEMSRRITERFFEAFDLTAVNTLHCFIPIHKFNEVDTSLIYKRVWSDFQTTRTLAPRLDLEADEIRNFAFSAESDLFESSWGIREPVGSASVEPSEIDLVIVPLLCFDDRGYRVGYGKGYYDKLLSKCRLDCLKIGLSYFPPVEVISDLSEYDIAVDACISPETTFVTQRK
ncbi:5-formyltetrahydrofolate cyclo-ligase [soil metagenome]